jgi:hypothetical protein
MLQPMKIILLAFLGLCGWLSGCSSDTEQIGELPRADRSLGDISKFLSAVASAEEISIYEGLPHPAWEQELYAAEAKRADLVWFEGYPFYAKPLGLPEVEKKQLSAIALAKEGHVPFGLPKFCGGFHPDYVIVWTKQGKKSGSLICFGCHEWKNFTPAGRLYEDLSPAAYDQLRGILSKYVVQRPKRKEA